MWVELHSWIGVITAIIVIIHLVIHWQWLKETAGRFKSYIVKRQKMILERYITVFLLFVFMVFQTLSGCVLWLVMPRGLGDFNAMIQGMGRTFWGLQRNEWLDLHAWASVLMLAIVIIHLIIHWRWNLNMTLGKKEKRDNGEMENTTVAQKPYQSEFETTDNEPSYLPRAGFFIGLVGAISFLVFMVVYQQLDQAGRYDYMLYLIPIPFVFLLLAWKQSYIGGGLLILLSVATIFLSLNNPLGMHDYKFNAGLGYMLVCVTIPIFVSGCLYVLSGLKNRKKFETYKE
ncbi:MAG: DUF4405 domain-containing protein, partial [Dehalococcoidales bacterium]|nr:DUF4405 domain-containing protein [Dehalococcoidales bacterium]